MTVWHQHALDFAQYLVRVVRKFKHMRQQHQINAGADYRQFSAVRTQAGAASAIHSGTQRHAIGVQQIKLRQPYLHCVIAENIRHRLVDVRALPREQILPQRGLQPCGRAAFT